MMINNALKAGLLAAALAIATAAPASAGSFTLSLTPRGDSADLIRSGLQMYGIVIERLGPPSGVPIAFALMAAAYILAALGTLPIRADERAEANAAHEAGLPEA